MSILDSVRGELNDAELQRISQQIGADPNATKQAVDAALPLLAGGAEQAAGDPADASGVQSLFGSGALEGLGGLLGGAGGSGIGGILGKILGHNQPAVEDATQKASGLDGSQVKKLLMILGPIVLAALARKHGAGGTAATGDQGSGSLGDILGKITGGASPG